MSRLGAALVVAIVVTCAGVFHSPHPEDCDDRGVYDHPPDHCIISEAEGVRV